MKIKFQGKEKSLTDFEWDNIPMFSVITGPNGTGKTQLLDIIYNTIINKQKTSGRVQIENQTFQKNEIVYLKGEWELNNTGDTSLSSIQQTINSHYTNFVNNKVNQNNEHQINLYYAFQEIEKKAGKHRSKITKQEFVDLYPEVLIEQAPQISQKIADVFYNYRLSEIELLSKRKTEREIIEEIGEKPWDVLKDILKESKLPFSFNNPSGLGFRDSFQLQVINEITNDPVNFNDLSSGEKVLISLVFYLYNSQEKNTFPKILLMDEPDAHLHPSMSQQFINVVNNVLVQKFGVRVIMTTHSPSTVILTPKESLFEMSRITPRIKLSESKNNTISLLTSGLIYVGEGTKYFLVEDKDDVSFYSYQYDYLNRENLLNGDIPLVFIPASTKDKSGGKDVVQNWVNKLQESGINSIIQGLIDKDSGNTVSEGIHIIDRYSIENYLIDPLVIYATLMDKEKHNECLDLGLTVGEEYKLKTFETSKLQEICDVIFTKSIPLLKKHFEDFDEELENERVLIKFTNNCELYYPKWLLIRRGKTILNQVYNELFTSRIINFTTLFKGFKKINFIPEDMLTLFENLKG